MHTLLYSQTEKLIHKVNSVFSISAKQRSVSGPFDFGIRPNLKLNALWQLSLFVCHASENVRPLYDISCEHGSFCLSCGLLNAFMTTLKHIPYTSNIWQEITSGIPLAPLLCLFFPIRNMTRNTNFLRDVVNFKPCQVNATIQFRCNLQPLSTFNCLCGLVITITYYSSLPAEDP